MLRFVQLTPFLEAFLLRLASLPPNHCNNPLAPILLTELVLNELSHSAFATIAAATCGVHPLAIQKLNIDFATELVVFNVYELEVEADEADEIVKDFDLLFGETYFCGFTGVPFVPENHSWISKCK
jgi:hypothetical protein